MTPAAQGPGTAPAQVVDASLESAPVLDKAGYAYVIHPLTDGVPRTQPELLAAWRTWAAARVGALPEAPTLLLAPEAMALPLAAALSLELGMPYVVARKRRYDLPGERVVRLSTGYHEATLYINDVGPDDRVVVVDDVLSTGGTLDAVLGAIGDACTVLGALVFLDKGRRRGELAARHGVPVLAMRTVDVEAGRVRVAADHDGGAL